MAGKHDCAVPGCGKQVAAGILMCAPHWRMVPKAEQRAVWRTWNAFCEGGSRTEYESAVAAAVACVKKTQEAL